MSEVRIDKWLWAVRIFKTRSVAAEACKKGNVLVDNVAAKPSRMVKIGDVIQVRKNPVVFSFKVIGLLQNRVGAKLVENYMENVTTPEQLEMIELHKIAVKNARARGTGRPTKKERREIDDFFDPNFFSDSDLDDFDIED